jgi:plastocyanin
VGGDTEDPGLNTIENPDGGMVALTTTSPLSANINLAEPATFVFDVSSPGDYSGDVTLALTGVPSTWPASVSPQRVTLAPGSDAQVTVSVNPPSDAIAGTGILTFTATAGPQVASANMTVQVANNVVIFIPPGTGRGSHPFPMVTVVHVGTTVTFADNDATANHRMHFSGQVGCNHQPNDMTEGQGYQVTPTTTGDAQFYCHDHGPGDGNGIVRAIP